MIGQNSYQLLPLFLFLWQQKIMMDQNAVNSFGKRLAGLLYVLLSLTIQTDFWGNLKKKKGRVPIRTNLNFFETDRQYGPSGRKSFLRIRTYFSHGVSVWRLPVEIRKPMVWIELYVILFWKFRRKFTEIQRDEQLLPPSSHGVFVRQHGSPLSIRLAHYGHFIESSTSRWQKRQV